MKNKNIRIISLLLVLITALSAASLQAFALEWDGESEGGFAGDREAGPNGYAIRYTDNRNLLGYRFSVVNATGEDKVSKVIDVFRNIKNAPYGDQECERAYKFTVKRNKKKLIEYQNGSFSTSKNSTNCYKEEDMGFVTELPTPDGMQTWQNYTSNLNKILSALGVGSISNLKNGDKILAEPLYDIRLEGSYHALTVTEMAIYGKHFLGAESNGGSSSTSESWGFIAGYVNRIYPNSLFTPDGQGLWTGVSASSSKIKFKDIINKGYGVGIAYTETKSDFSPTLSVKECRAYKGAKSVKTYHYGTSTGNAFAYWTYVTNYPKSGEIISFSVNFPKETENCYVKQTVWIDGVQIDTRKGYSNNLEWFDFAASSNTVPASKSYYTVKARVDWIETNGTVKKTGAEKTFYIPVKPIVTREKVSAYNEESEVQAYSGSAGSSGKLYFGQKVTFQYKYGATTTWESSNTVTAIANRWNGSSWTHIYTANTDGKDVSQSSVGLSKTKSYTKNSSIGTYTIPLPAKEDTNSYRLKFDLGTAWNTDKAHTTESTTYYLPVVKSDVELFDILLVDGDGNYVDKSNLTVNDTLTVHYVYKNNTDCKVYVKGYNDDKTQIPGVYAIDPGETIEVEGSEFIVPNERTFYIWGGVYLDTVARGNTDYETDGTNNHWLTVCHSNIPLSLTAIAPNAPYREGTDVISSFRIWNYVWEDYIPSDGLKVRLRVYKDGATTPFKTVTKNVVVPAASSNLVYFKWKVPTGLSGKNVTLKADIYYDGQYWNEISNKRATTLYTHYQTPDTQYEENAPSGFNIPANPSGSTGAANWWIYEYQNGSFVKKTYQVTLSKSSPNKIEPATGETAEKVGGVWTMKSGYGISLQSRILINNAYGSNIASSDSYTLPQYAYAAFPEYGYVHSENKATTLNKVAGEAYSYFEFPSFGSYGKVHFTPLWYPDGSYTVKIVQSDCWTPSGMISTTIIPNTIKINGNAYDDWYAGRR